MVLAMNKKETTTGKAKKRKTRKGRKEGSKEAVQ